MLKGNLSGYYSRRINQEHGIVYTVSNNELIIIQCKYHY
ncbi:MAG: Txe/YoeB family addiction module toxin [Candidatus Cloacimonadota bacterium]|nr:MAG: Txe/YoeB family addiction module toxin [Candidatus Cloacimonadota bacterium]